jgi:Set1/Ash2 histone methyltransferase complex subunit ASH2
MADAAVAPALDAVKRPAADGGDVDANQRRKKKRQAGKEQAGEVVQVPPQDYVRIVPFRKPQQDELSADTVLLSKIDRAAQLQLSADRLTVTGTKGYRTVRATHGVYQGCYYCEVTVGHLGATGHCRLGWSNKQSDIQAPVGFDANGFSYRDLEGTKVYKALREPYGEPYQQGDTIGLLLYMPPGGRPMERRMHQVVKYKGQLYHVDEGQAPAAPLEGSCLGFTKNGVFQGVAYSGLMEGTYYPSASLYTLPEQTEGASVTFNFGPEFKYPPPEVPEFPAPRPCSDLPAWYQQAQLKVQLEDKAAAAAAAAAAEADAAAQAGEGGAAGGTTAAGEAA